MNRFLGKYILILTCSLSFATAYAQQGGQRYTTIDDRLEEITDSIENVTYPYIFPILGDKVTAKGFDLPLPFGLMVNAVTGKQNVTLENLAVGFGEDGSLTDVSEIAIFRSVAVDAQTINIRPDVWILPFLNIYGLAGYIRTNTIFSLALPFDLQGEAEATGPYYGFGVAAAGGVGPVWLSADASYVWVKTSTLDQATGARIIGIRMGHTFVFRKNPQKNVSFWIGAMEQKLESTSTGSIRLSEVINPTGENIDEIKSDLVDWYNTLGPLRQQVVEQIYNVFLNYLDGVEDPIVRYSFDKKLANPWSMAVGAQWQMNKRWQLRSEYNFLGSRNQFLLSLNYRFGIKGRTVASGKQE